MADFTALQRIIGRQANAQAQISARNRARQDRQDLIRQQYVNRVFLNKGIDPQSVPQEKVGDVLQLLLSADAAQEQQAAQDAVNKEQRRLFRQGNLDVLSVLRDSNDPNAPALRAEATYNLTGKRFDPKKQAVAPSSPQGIIDKYAGQVPSALVQMGVAGEEDLSNPKANIFRDEMTKSRAVQSLSDWFLAQSDVSGQKWATDDLAKTFSRTVLSQMEENVPESPFLWGIFGSPEHTPQKLGYEYENTGRGKSVTPLPGEMSIYENEAAPAQAPTPNPLMPSAKPVSTAPQNETTEAIAKYVPNEMTRAIMLGIVQQESNYGKYSHNLEGSSARGAFQMMPDTFLGIISQPDSALHQLLDYAKDEKGNVDPKKLEQLSLNTDYNVVAARELLADNLEKWPELNMLAAIASHHYGVGGLLSLYRKYKIDFSESPLKLVASMKKEGKLTKTQKEFVDWLPKVIGNIRKHLRG